MLRFAQGNCVIKQWRSAQWIGVLLIVAMGLSFSPAIGSGASAQDKEATYEEEVQKGLRLLTRRRYEEALKSFKRANEMREKKSPECLVGIAQAYLGMEEYKEAIENCDKAIAFAGGDTKFLLPAYNLKGLALQAQAEGKNQKKLQESETALRQGLALGGDLPMLHYNLGYVLMQQNRDAEGTASLQKYLELQPEAANAAGVRKIIENPRRTREPYAPEFSFITAAGEHIALEDLRGKVVVLDFWGTWCGPCVAAVPALRRLQKKYAKDPAFVMIGISSDGVEDKWQTFIAENEMAWHHYLDSEQQVLRSFGVRSFPTYMVISHEGIVRYRSVGGGRLGEADLDDAVRKELKNLAKAAQPN